MRTNFRPMYSICNILTFDPAVNQETGASGRRYQGITLTGWIRCNCGAHKKQVGVKQLYNRVPQMVWVSWSQLVGVRGSENQLPAEGLGPQDPRLSSPAEWERSAAKDRGTWGQYVAVCFVSNSPLTHNPFTALLHKVWEVYFFLKNCVRSFIIVDYISACICVSLYMYYGNATNLLYRWHCCSHEPQSKDQRNRYNLDRGRVKFGANMTLTGSRWVTNNYINRCHGDLRELESVAVEVRVAVRGSENQLPAEGWALRIPYWAAQQNEKRSAAIVRGTWGQYVAVCFVSNSPLTHNPFTTLSNKVWEVYFSKEVCSFVIIVNDVSACICIRIVVSRLYNI